MKITEIPFSKYVGITQKDEEILKLELNSNLQNHIGSIHASAQFTLAETQSGLFLELAFPEYQGEVVPLLRSSSVKYKNPATKAIYATATATKESLEKFEAQFLKKGRASITVFVEVKDSDDIVTMVGEFSWFIQKV